MTIDPSARTYTVSGISCDHCKRAIEGEVASVTGVVTVDVDIERKIVTVVGGDDTAIRGAIDEAGYDID